MIPSPDGAAATEPPKLGQCGHAKIGPVLAGLISFSGKSEVLNVIGHFRVLKQRGDWHIEGQTFSLQTAKQHGP